MSVKPLFIPLKTKYYREFESGSKTHEYRRYGGPWNERTCAVGRPVTISRGYSTPDRLSAIVKGFRKVYAPDLPVRLWVPLHSLYGALENLWVAEIELEITPHAQPKEGEKDA